jgi:Carboxypeptidase regulatory-like domain
MIMTMRSKWICGCGLAALLGVQLSLMAAAPGKEVPAPVRRTAPAARPTNPHLHGLESAAATVHKEEAKPEKGAEEKRHEEREAWWRHWHSRWRTRWYYVGWINIHRGLGTVLGQVVGADGVAVERAELNLRRAGGQIFSKQSDKHIVHSGVSGNFIMRRVRAGRYRVVANGNGENGFAQVRVHVWQSSVVNIRL